MSGLVTPAWLVVCTVLVSAGIGKLRNTTPPPDPNLRGQTRLRRVTGAARRPIACMEIMLGTAAAWAPVPILAASVAASYAVFAVVHVHYLRTGATEGCGCFGAGPEAATHPLQIGLNGVCALVAIAASVESPYRINWLTHQPVLVVASCALGLAAASVGAVAAFTVPTGRWPGSPRRRCSS